MESSSSKDGLNKSPILERLPISRPHGSGTKGNQIRLRTNHFKVSVRSTDVIFYHYHVNMKNEDDFLKRKNEDDKQVKSKGVARTVINKLQDTYLSNVNFIAYDGEENLYTICALQNVKDEFIIVVEDGSSAKTTARSRTPGGNGSPEGSDTKRMKRLMHCKTYKVELSKKGEIPLSAIDKVLRGQESDDCQEALKVLDIILRQKSVKQGCLLVRQSFFHSPSEPVKLGGGVVRCPGYHSSFQPTQSGLKLNIDVSTTMIVEPGPVINFILSNQYIKEPCRIDWGKAKRALKNLRIKTTHTNSEFKIVSLSEKSCYEQKFTLKQKNDTGSDFVEITVYDYYLKHWDIRLQDSANFPCLDVGKPKRPTYLPIELCHLVSLQRYTKSLTPLQRSTLVQSSRKNPRERKSDLSSALQRSNYNSDDMLKKCGISIAPEFSQVDGRVLQAPKLKAGDGQYLIARDGRWNFMNRKLIETKGVHKWTAVNFTTNWKLQDLVQRLIHCGGNKGINISPPQSLFEERLQRNASAASRVDAMLEQIGKKIQQKLCDPPTFLLCVLPDKNSDLYGPWKRECLVKYGVVTQCLAPKKIDDQYLTNVMLKINAKLGGLNSLLEIERNKAIPIVSMVPTTIFGIDVSHGAPRSNVPSIAAVVSSLGWPCISRYRASVCSRPPRVEIIDSLYKPQGEGLISELLRDMRNSGERRPEQIIIFRDGVSEGQFNHVLNTELAQIIEACKFLDDNWFPKFIVIVAQKNHHTRFFREDNDTANVPAGTVVDTGICHPRNYDFYMCAHAGRIGTTRPTHYQVLHDDIGFTPDALQELVHCLSYVYQRSTSAISVVAPVYYAHLAAAQVRKFDRRFDDAMTHPRRRRRPVAIRRRRFRSCLGCIGMSGLPCSSAELSSAAEGRC